MHKPWRMLSALAAVGLAGSLWTATDPRSDAHAADNSFRSSASPRMSPVAAAPRLQQQGTAAAGTPPAPTVFRQYCVGCHNDRMKGSYGNLSLENLDPNDVSGHVETLEKIVRKLRKGEMPPEGRQRPDPATLEKFVASIEAALDGASEQEPNPGRVVSRRLNRTEYV